ncbi:MAG: hypothetical protein WB686_15460, partial [Pseudolabrys sp.]
LNEIISGAAHDVEKIAERPRIMITTDDQRNAEFVSPTYDSLLARSQHCCQCPEADAGDRLLQDQRIV